MKKKWIALLLSATLITAGATPAYAAEFSDGTLGTEVSNDSGSDNDSSDFTDSALEENGFVSEEEGTPIAEDDIPVIDDLMSNTEAASVEGKIYTINFEGKLILDQTQEFVRLLNIEREKLGVPPVQIDQQMMEKAIKRAPEVAVFFDHIHPVTGESAHDAYIPSAECCAASRVGKDGAKAFIEVFRSSPGHWAALTDKERTRIGVAICSVPEMTSVSGNRTFYRDYITVQQTDTFSQSLEAYTGGFANSSKLFSQPINEKYFGELPGEDCTYTLLDVGEKTKEKPSYINVSVTNPNYRTSWFFQSISTGYWKSLTPDIVSVDQNGTVTALAPGDGVVRYYLEEGSNEFDEKLFEVREKEEYVPALPAPKVTASVSGYKNVKLTWKKVPGAIRYYVYKYNGESYRKIKTLIGNSSTSLIDKVGYGKTVQYKVRAGGYVDDMFEYGKYSSVKTVKTAPATPSVTKLSNASKRKLKLTWKRPSGAEGYVIYRKAGKNGSYKKIKTITSAKTLSYTNSGLKKGTTYYYKIRAYRKGADKKNIYSKWSKVIGSTCR